MTETIPKQHWRKLGLIFSPSGQHPWMTTHASNPLSMHLGGDAYRVYLSCRNEKNHSYVGFVEIEVRDRNVRVTRVCDRPVLSPGPLGYFDDHGVYSSSIVKRGDDLLMYYIGFSPGSRRPLFYTAIGLAISRDGGETFEKLYKAPILSRSEHDPWMVTAPTVRLEGELWRMWYVSGLGWIETDAGLVSYYHIKYAESRDGLHWERHGAVAIDHEPGETNFSRPAIVKQDDAYHMWYSYAAGSGYNIGYARSGDGYTWSRHDDAVDLPRSADGWDSNALAYPWVFVHERRRYIMYCGNLYGRDGFGMAVEE